MVRRAFKTVRRAFKNSSLEHLGLFEEHLKLFEEHLKTIWCVIAAIADMVSVEMMTNLSLLK